MNLKTSTKISIKFTIFTTIIVFLFGIFANIIFLQKRTTPLNKAVNNLTSINTTHSRMDTKMMFKNHFKDNITIKKHSDDYKLLIDNIVIKNVSKISDKYFYLKDIGNNNIIVLDITQQIKSQLNLIRITIYLLVGFGVLAYFISIYFVKSSLYKLNNLVDHVKKLDVDNLNKKIKIKGPKDDEINILAIKMNTALDKIHKQTLSLKDFVTNASHELKTPLMAINTEIDYAIKSKKYKQGLENNKIEIKNISNLLDELVLITKIDSQIKLEKKENNLSNIVLKNIKTLNKNYENKEIKLNKKIDSVDKFVHNSSFDIISKNLIENAFKYTDSGTIEVTLTNNEFIVKDTGHGIENKNLNKIWDRFWQEDKSKSDTKSFGLGLYLTKLLVEKHGRKIVAKSTKGKGSEFKIIF